MDRNQVEIRLLKNSPGKLLVKYQRMIRIIVRVYIQRGMISQRDQQDMIQEINRKLIERLPKIQKQYNGSSQLRTYFSVIVRNMCLEELRKPFMLSEPDQPPYESNQLSEEPVDLFLVRQEYERLQRVLQTFGKYYPRLCLIMKCFANVNIGDKDLSKFPVVLSSELRFQILDQLESSIDEQRKDQYQILSDIIDKLEGRRIPPESLRKWYASRQEECLRLLNGKPPKSSYGAETLIFLVERGNLNNKSE
ncbi:MAG: sigma-70 family RNA polymerase sigma factor [Bacteroidetes bacterium]|jgi:RNA polymerase sigma factor (sigma-70 family)|nr:sigma-70 family RNA polymerase sigma factor [Bacteroidota bacterium]